MEKMLVAVFDNETKAYEGLSALKNLDANGDISLYASAVVTVDAEGKLKIQQTADQGPIGMATGMFIGGLVGLIGGPVGLVIGAAAGSVPGLAFDISNDNVNVEFAEEVAGKLTNGKTALIAEINETWTVPVDTRLDELDGIVFRRLRYEVEDDQLQRESEALAAEYKEWKNETKDAINADKEKIKKSVAKLKEKAQVTNQQIERKIDEANDQFAAKLEKLEQQQKEAGERRKEKLQKRINALKEEYAVRSYKLKQASKLINEAFELKREKPELQKEQA